MIAFALRICVIIFNLGFTFACFGDNQNDFGVMTPDFIVQRGDKFELNCTLHTQKINFANKNYQVNSSLLIFKHHNKLIRNEQIHIIDNLTATMTVDASHFNDTGSYYCYLNIPGQPIMVCTTLVKVGEPPGHIANEDFQCESLHFENLTCNWRPKFTNIPTDYNLVEVISFGQRFARACPLKIKENSCQWSIHTSPPYRHQPDVFTFMLSSNNSLGRYEQLFYIDHFDIIKPDKPQEFSLFNFSSTLATVEWLAPKIIEHDSKASAAVKYQLTVERYEGEAIVEKKIFDVGNVLSYVIKDLIPNTIYRLSLRCRISERESDDVWSDYTLYTFRTFKDVPYLAPELFRGAFESMEVSEGYRTVTVYWKPIKKKFYNGNGFRYVLEALPKDEKLRSHSRIIREDIFDDNFLYKIENLKANAAYKIRMFGKNDIGESLNKSIIIIEPHQRLPVKPKEVSVYDYNDGKYEVMWEIEEIDKKMISGYTIYACVQSQSFTCDGPLRQVYTVHSPNVSSATFNIAKAKFRFAVSTFSIEKKSLSPLQSNINNNNHLQNLRFSSLVWSTCLIPIGNVATPKIREFRVEVYSPTAVKVYWNVECKALQKYIKNYIIFYCQPNRNGECVDNKKYQKIVFNTDGILETDIDELKPNKMYLFYILSLSNTNVFSAPSDLRIVTTVPGAPSSPLNIKTIDLTSNSLTLEWFADKLEKINHFVIMFSDEHEKTILNIENCMNIDKYRVKCVKEFRNLLSYHRYRIHITACVSSQMNGTRSDLCSPTEMLDVLTKISRPSQMEKPFFENYNNTTIRLSWKKPDKPNGPIDYYRLFKTYDNLDNDTEIIKIDSSVLEYYFEPVCDALLSVQIQAVNLNGFETLYGELSEQTKINGCMSSASSNKSLIIGLSFGVTIAAVTFVFLIVISVKWMKKKIDAVKAVKIQLPEGLQSLPFPDFETNGDLHIKALSKEKTFHKNHSESDTHTTIDSIEFATIYNKRRQNSGTSHLTDSSTDGLLKRLNNKSANDSGHSSGDENSAHGDKHLKRSSSEEQSETGTINGHESVASELTYATHVLSIDSGTSGLGDQTKEKCSEQKRHESGNSDTPSEAQMLSLDSATTSLNYSVLPTKVYHPPQQQKQLEDFLSFVPSDLHLSSLSLSSTSSSLTSPMSTHITPKEKIEVQMPTHCLSSPSSLSNSPLFTKSKSPIITTSSFIVPANKTTSLNSPLPPVTVTSTPSISPLSLIDQQSTTATPQKTTETNPYIAYEALLNLSQKSSNLNNNNEMKPAAASTAAEVEPTTNISNENHRLNIIQPEMKMNSNGYVSIPTPHSMLVQTVPILYKSDIDSII